MTENQKCRIIIRFEKEHNIHFTCLPENKQLRQIETAWKKCNIRFDRNEIISGEDDGIDVLKELIEYSSDFKTINIKYQNEEYELLPETLLSFIIKEFVDEIGKRFIIVKAEVIIEDQFDPIIRERIYASLHILHLQHEEHKNSSLKEKEEMYIQQEEMIYKIIEKQEDYQRFKRVVERVGNIATKEKKFDFPSDFDANQTWNGNQSNWNSIERLFTMKEREKLKLFRLDYSAMFIVSRYFETIDDHINLVIGIKKLRGLLEQYRFNPVELTTQSRSLFPNIETLYLYRRKGELFLDDKKIKKRIYGKPISYEEWKNMDDWKQDTITFPQIVMKDEECFKRNGKTIPVQVNTLSDECFNEYLNVNNLKIPLSVTSIRKRCFFNCSYLEKISIPTSITRLEDQTFAFCFKLTSISLPQILKHIGDRCFEGCKKLNEIVIPESVDYIGNGTFKNCEELSKLTIGSQWQLQGNILMNTKGHNLRVVEIPSSIKEINGNQVKMNELTTFVIPSGITSIGNYSFCNMTFLTSISIPTTVKVIGDYAFYNTPINIRTETLKKSELNPAIVYDEEMKQLEEWTGMEFKQTIFDGEIDEWKTCRSRFDERLMNKEKLIILIEDEKGNVFGGFINSTRMEPYRVENDGWKGEKIIDPDAFLFILRINKKERRPMQIGVKRNVNDKSFILNTKSSERLFSIFGKEIVVMKHERDKMKSYCNGEMAKYLNQTTEIKFEFNVKRIQVYQMEGETNKMEEDVMYQYQSEKKQLEELCHLSTERTLFDSDFDSWKQGNSDFSNRIDRKKNIVIMIEDTNNNIFGVFINNIPTQTSKYIAYPYEFVFSLNSNGRCEQPMIFPMHNYSESFCLCGDDDERLFSVGCDDIIIMKEDCQDKSHENSCHQKCFDYNGIDDAFCGSSRFKVKRIMVYQMTATNEQKKLMMEMNTKTIKTSIKDEIKQLEEWSGTTFKEIVFDSNIHSWEERHSDFYQTVMNKEKLIIMIEDNDGNVFGGYVHSKVTHTYDLVHNEWIGEKKIDPHVFMFFLRTGDNGKRPIKIERELNDSMFVLFDKQSRYLFSFCGNDIFVMKDRDSSYYNGQLSSHMFNSPTKHNFRLKRMLVFQMEGETNQMEEDVKYQYQREREKIEELCSLSIDSVVFDSDFDSWRVRDSVFKERVLWRSNYVIMIEDNESNIFGIFKTSPIMTTYEYYEDRNSFFFSIDSNERKNGQLEIKKSKYSRTFQLNENDEQKLFSVGYFKDKFRCDDITIMKEEYQNEEPRNRFHQYCFDRNGRKKELFLKDRFEVKRIMVYQVAMGKDQKLLQFQENARRMRTTMSGEIEQIEKWSLTTYRETIFDSDLHKWKRGNSEFDKIILNNEKLVFLIEDNHGNVFGGYVDAKIDGYQFCEHGEWKGSAIIDPKTFVFSLKSNGRLEGPMKFNIKSEDNDNAFQIFNQENEVLFSFGKKDIVIKKENQRTTSYCEQFSFDYQGGQGVLVGREGEWYPFLVKRIQVWRMEETEEQKRTREGREQEREERERREKEEKQHKYVAECEVLRANAEKIKEEFTTEIRQIEEWSGLKCCSIVFDSDKCDWSVGTSTFDRHVWSKGQLAFLVETENNVKQGGFVNSQIVNHQTVDPRSFVFIFEGDQQTRYVLRENNKDKSTFLLGEDWEEEMFIIGKGLISDDILIRKKGMTSICCQNPYSFYDYQGDEKEETKFRYEDKFQIKRIVVIEFE